MRFATSSPPAFATFDIATETRALAILPLATFVAMASKLEPRPESRMPMFFIKSSVVGRSASGYSSTSQTSDNHREAQESRVSLLKSPMYFGNNSRGCFFEQLTWDSVIEAADKSWVGSEDLET
jgi:hypothetical protein